MYAYCNTLRMISILQIVYNNRIFLFFSDKRERKNEPIESIQPKSVPKSNIEVKEILKPKEESNIVKPKKMKTRSKQKNIRKDRRADHVKPAHLQIGNADYAGRPLTEVRCF